MMYNGALANGALANGALAHFTVINRAVARCYKKVGHPGNIQLFLTHTHVSGWKNSQFYYQYI